MRTRLKVFYSVFFLVSLLGVCVAYGQLGRAVWGMHHWLSVPASLVLFAGSFGLMLMCMKGAEVDAKR